MGRPISTEIDYFGYRLTVHEASEKCNVSVATLRCRIKNGETGIRLLRPKAVKTEAQCPVCAKMFPMGRGKAKKYCSRSCAHTTYRKTQDKPCGTCGRVFTPKPANRRDKEESYCSRWCSTRSLLKVQGLYCSLPDYTRVVRAEVCGHYVMRRWENQKYCSKECTLRWLKIRRRMSSGPLKCIECEAIFTPILGARNYCSYECSNRHTRRTHKARRRAWEKGRGLVDEINPYKIFIRDRWMCRACGCSAPRELRGSYDPCAPELDHVVPLSKGGSHTMDNLQLLCRKCNGKKGNSLDWNAA